jgi:hypothetical protein
VRGCVAAKCCVDEGSWLGCSVIEEAPCAPLIVAAGGGGEQGDGSRSGQQRFDWLGASINLRRWGILQPEVR